MKGEESLNRDSGILQAEGKTCPKPECSVITVASFVGK